MQMTSVIISVSSKFLKYENIQAVSVSQKHQNVHAKIELPHFLELAFVHSRP